MSYVDPLLRLTDRDPRLSHLNDHELEARVMSMVREVQKGEFSLGKMDSERIIQDVEDFRGEMEIAIESGTWNVRYEGHNAFRREPWAGDFVKYELHGSERRTALVVAYFELLPQCRAYAKKEALRRLAAAFSVETFGFDVGEKEE